MKDRAPAPAGARLRRDCALRSPRAIRLETAGPAAAKGASAMNTMEITKFVGAICGSLLDLPADPARGARDLRHRRATSSPSRSRCPRAARRRRRRRPGRGRRRRGAVAAADVAKGETVFKKCAACHKLDGSNGVGPHLDGVVGRPVASVEGFTYSDGMKAHGGDWTPEELFHFLANPKKDVPGTKMTFAGLPKPEDRANVIAYLEYAAVARLTRRDHEAVSGAATVGIAALPPAAAAP